MYMERTIYFEREVCEYLGIPSIPKRVWDGKSSFRDGVAVVELCDGSEAYAVATFDADSDASPTVKKVFTLERFLGVREVYVVPPYMDGDVQSFDLSDEDKRKAQAILDEAKSSSQPQICQRTSTSSTPCTATRRPWRS